METNTPMDRECQKPKIQIKSSPDNTFFYSYGCVKEHLPKAEFNKISMQDAILLLLYAQPDNPINGRISLMKQTFLLTHEILKDEKVQNGRFVKHYYGWYSFQVMNDVKNLEFIGLISRKGKTNSKLEQFQITQNGKMRIQRLFNSLSPNLQKIVKDKRKGWDQLGYDGILNYMYTHYPESIEKSLVKEKYKPIKWGKSKG